MNGIQIHNVLKNELTTKYNFGGIYNNNMIHNEYHSSKYIIFNTLNGESTKMGHWVCFIYFQNIMYFIDSFGMHVDFYGGAIKKYYNNCPHDKQHLVKFQIQNTKSLLCGAYVIYFIYFFLKGFKPHAILQRFSSTKHHTNDTKIERFIFRLTNTHLKCRMSFCPKYTFHTPCRDVCVCLHENI